MSHLLPIPNYGLIAHRGASSLAPENTLISFTRAAEMGLNWIEFDIRLTKCGNWVLMHDATLNRTTNGTGNISNLTLEEIKKLDAGNWFDKKFTNTPIPTLQETMLLAKQHKLGVNIEVKGSKENTKQHIDLLLEFLHTNQSNIWTKPLITSFDINFMQTLKKVEPSIMGGYVVEEFTADTVPIALEHGFSNIHCCFEDLKIADLELARKYNISVLTYTINDPKIAQYWLDAGVTAIFTDKADLLRNVLLKYKDID